ncbi:GNAT family N-acetyltransferase [Amycolatopsis mongoliensis]|uniref:GNAT family N-acetyltransferase n=1 Tax=Amycolatopsis mongoliensis TaxID=715475 RepID=A0A9Y2NDR2_9PSEU|nr:GNAT family N-acetyltransferase [Amycolatopsis sp. 4-36]WIY00977.1 GNAT family N-acetyltransferase [Amycolatopsis sp. 4-36]
MNFSVAVATRIAELDPERWDQVVDRTGASIFYHRVFLEAFEKFPLHPVEKAAYLTVCAADGEPVAVLPAFLTHGTDPMHVLHDHLPGEADEPVLLSHVWHCYQSTLPTVVGNAGSWPAAVTVLSELAGQWGAAAHGFVNVDRLDPLSAWLDRAGHTGVDIEVGWGTDLSGCPSIDVYLGRLSAKRRGIMRQYLRRGDSAGVRRRWMPARDGDLDGFVRLARHTATKFDNADYYQPGLFQNFVAHLGTHAWLEELRIDGELVGAALVLFDRRRTHFFASGFDLAACDRFSPFYLLFAGVVEEGIRRGLPWLAAGRRNPDFKRRHGLTSTVLRAHLARTGPLMSASVRAF